MQFCIRVVKLSLNGVTRVQRDLVSLVLQVLGSISLAERTFEPPAVEANAARAAAGKAEAKRKKAERAAQVGYSALTLTLPSLNYFHLAIYTALLG